MSYSAQQGRFGGRPQSRIEIGRDSPVVDSVFVALPFVAILFNLWFGSLTPVLVAGSLLFYIAFRFERVVPVLLRCWPLLLLPVFCIASALWSRVPGTTAYYGTLFLLTVIPACLIGAGTNGIAALKGIFGAFSLYTICSIAFGRWVNWNDGGIAYAGLAGSKNAAGDTAALTILVSSMMIMWALGQKKRGWVIAAAATLPFALFCLVFSRATGVLIASIIALPCMAAWVVSRRLDPPVRNMVFLSAGVIILLLVGTSSQWMPVLFDAILTEAGKTAGLTGRGFLWSHADRYIADRPIFGLGYNAFWVHNNLDAEFMWRQLGITTRQGFNFHNTPRDILVDLGYVGLVLFGTVAIFSAIRLFGKVMLAPKYFGIFCCTLAVFEMPRIFFEQIGFANMHFSTLIVFTILSYAYRAQVAPIVNRS